MAHHRSRGRRRISATETVVCSGALIYRVLGSLERIVALLWKLSPRDDEASITWGPVRDYAGTAAPSTHKRRTTPGGDMIITTAQKVTASFKAKNSKTGKAARVDGVPRWENLSPEVVNLEVPEDGKSVVVTPKTVGTAEIRCTADADLGAGVRELTAIGLLSVIEVEEEADTVEIAFGEAETA